jgi:hypothetical protein
MFIGRREDGSIYGAWTCKQADDDEHSRIEELPDDHPEVIAFLNRPIPKAPLTDGDLAKVLIAKGFLTDSEVDAAIAASVKT